MGDSLKEEVINKILYSFTLSKSQIIKLKKFQEKVKKKHGKYGIYDYKFSPTGIGEIDLTEYETW